MVEIVASPILVGRDELLALVDRRVAQAAAGEGHLLLVSGEAGCGKTRLLGSISRRAELSDFVILRAAAFPGDVEVSGGVLLDLAGDLRRATGTGLQAAGLSIAERLRAPVSAEGGDPHRQRRLLVQDLADALSALDPSRRTLLVLEDVHWADQLSLDVLRHIAGRLSGRSTLLVAACRSDELYPGTPIREFRSRLLSQRQAEEIRVPRLTEEQTAVLIGTVLGRPAPAQLVTAIHERSDGIPLHVEELLAASGGGSATQLHFPDTLADTVLARAAGLDPRCRDIAAAAAVIGREFDFDLLALVANADAAEVDHCLRELRSLFLVQDRGDSGFDFRHALIRDALYADVPLPRRRELHRRVAEAAAERGYRPAFVSVHYEQAGISAEAYRFALLGAQDAAAVSAHREALQLCRRALRHLPSEATAAEQGALLTAIGDHATAVDENTEAALAYADAYDLLVRSGDPLAAAAVVPALAAVRHLLGDGLEQRVALLQGALRDIDDVAGAEPVRAQLLSGLAAAYMLDRRLDEALDYSAQSAAAGAVGDDPAALNTAATHGSVLLFTGAMDAGWSMLEGAITRSATALLEAEAARGYRMIGTSASVLVEYDKAEKWLPAGISYAAGVELWNHRSYMNAHLGHVQWATGHWTSAQRTAELALADGRGGITTRITAQYVLGYLALGRGEWESAADLLAEALELGESMAELQRVSPPLWGLAETALLRGDLETAVSLCSRGFAASHRVTDTAYLFPFLVTGTRALLGIGDVNAATRWVDEVSEALQHRAIPGTLPATTHARGLLQLSLGRLDDARTSLHDARLAWDARRRFWEGAWALVDEASCAVAARRHADAASLADAVRERAEPVGAAPLLAAAHELGRPANGQGGQPYHPLSAREYAVALLVAQGLTNRQIAGELFLSPKTVSSHVEHILAKLGAARRAEIAAWAARVGT